MHYSTPRRWTAGKRGGLTRLTNAQSHKKRLVYEFLERSPDFRTDIYRPAGHLPPGFLAYAAEHSARLGQPFAKDLSKLDGAFKMYRPAWTTPERRDRVLVSRLLFTTSRGFTRFREEQDYIDKDHHETEVRETDEGAVLFTSASIVLFGLGVNGERVKFFIVDNWYNELDALVPVSNFSGIMLTCAGRLQPRPFPFVAVRSQKPFSEIETAIVHPSATRLSPKFLAMLRIETGA